MICFSSSTWGLCRSCWWHKTLLAGAADSSGKRVFCFCDPWRFLAIHCNAIRCANTPVTFQHPVNTVSSGLSGCEALDDIMLYSGLWDEYIQQSQRDANLILNLANANLATLQRPTEAKWWDEGKSGQCALKFTLFSHSLLLFLSVSCAAFWGWQADIEVSVKNFSAVAALLTDLWVLRCNFSGLRVASGRLSALNH